MPNLAVSIPSFVLVFGLTHVTNSEEPVEFNRDVRPLLSSNCFQCHGPDEAQRQAELRLDTERGVRHAFDGGRDGSLAWERLSSDDPDLKMPPAESHRELSREDLEVLGRWVDSGAGWEGHWSFIAPRSPPIPHVEPRAWIRNPIDSFVLRRMQTAGLRPSPPADRERLLRRVSFDLTGLPPTLAEMDSFLADTAPGAFERVVDRLLASEHYGERMSLAWMDAARYGDSSVFHADGPRDMWPWRDWAIRAYNRNVPFDQFTIDQLAGDLIDRSTSEQRVATGFLRNNATTDEGGAIAEEYRVEYAVDRVKTMSMVWLGLSMECAQCHNHKYDPITQREYYQMFAYFNQASDPGMQTRSGNQTPVVDLYDERKLAEAERLRGEISRLETERDARELAVTAPFNTWLAEASQSADGPLPLPEDTAMYATLDEGKGRAPRDVAHEKRRGRLKGKVTWIDGKFGRAFECDGTNFIEFPEAGDYDRTDAFSYGLWLKPRGDAVGAPLARMKDGQAHRGFDIHCSGGIVEVHLIHTWPTNAIKVRTKEKLAADQWQHLFVTYDGSSDAAGIKIYIDGQVMECDVQENRLSETIRNDVPLQLGRRNPGSPFKGGIDDVRVYSRQLAPTEVSALAGFNAIAALLKKPAAERVDQDLATLKHHYLTTIDMPYQETVQGISSATASIAELSKPIVNVMVMKDVAEMRPTFILDRGHYASPREDTKILPGVPAALPPLGAEAEPNRLGLARWLVDPAHPLTARVTVNRYWAMFFGEGIVETVEDFGAQGSWPTHPELLDWLAVDFVEHGWDVKRTIKQMVMSSTYRQTSRVTPDRLKRDPENQWLSRGPRFRLQAEFIRDNALAASGLLAPAVGGPSVKPYQPPGLWNEVSLSGNVRFVQGHGRDLYRRSMYTYWKRSAPAPAMTTFDTPTREKCVLRRSRTNTPLQALVTLNDVQFVEAARQLAQRVLLAHSGDVDAGIATAYRLAAGVRPSPTTVATLRAAYDEELAVFQADAQRATELVSLGESERDDSLDVAVHAAMTVVTSLILNLDATLTRG